MKNNIMNQDRNSGWIYIIITKKLSQKVQYFWKYLNIICEVVF
jgi:hypothetical protein